MNYQSTAKDIAAVFAEEGPRQPEEENAEFLVRRRREGGRLGRTGAITAALLGKARGGGFASQNADIETDKSDLGTHALIVEKTLLQPAPDAVRAQCRSVRSKREGQASHYDHAAIAGRTLSPGSMAGIKGYSARGSVALRSVPYRAGCLAYGKRPMKSNAVGYATPLPIELCAQSSAEWSTRASVHERMGCFQRTAHATNAARRIRGKRIDYRPAVPTALQRLLSEVARNTNEPPIGREGLRFANATDGYAGYVVAQSTNTGNTQTGCAQFWTT